MRTNGPTVHRETIKEVVGRFDRFRILTGAVKDNELNDSSLVVLRLGNNSYFQEPESGSCSEDNEAELDQQICEIREKGRVLGEQVSSELERLRHLNSLILSELHEDNTVTLGNSSSHSEYKRMLLKEIHKIEDSIKHLQVAVSKDHMRNSLLVQRTVSIESVSEKSPCSLCRVF